MEGRESAVEHNVQIHGHHGITRETGGTRDAALSVRPPRAHRPCHSQPMFSTFSFVQNSATKKPC